MVHLSLILVNAFLEAWLEKIAATCKTTAASTPTETVDDVAEADEGGQAVSSSLPGHCGTPAPEHDKQDCND